MVVAAVISGPCPRIFFFLQVSYAARIGGWAPGSFPWLSCHGFSVAHLASRTIPNQKHPRLGMTQGDHDRDGFGMR